VPVRRPDHAIFDWRELQRWNVSESRLPQNREIRFRPQGVWQRFWWLIVAGASALVAQTLLITALLLSRVKRRRAEEALRESEGRFRALANSAPVLIRVSDGDLQCTDVNLPWIAFTGRPLEAELGSGWLSGVHADDRARYVETARRALEHRDPFRIEHRLRRRDGEYRWILTSSVPKFKIDGAFVGYIASAIDISDLKAARAALSNLSGRLMEAQEQERARVARELHDDVNQRMSFLAIELAQLRSTLPDSAADARGQMDALYDGVVALGRDIQAISHRLHSSKLAHVGLATAAASFCSEASTLHGLRIEFVHEHVPPDLPEGVAVSLFRVLQESVSNVVKHSGARRCMVTLRGVEDRVRLDVIDDGRGFEVNAALTGRGLGLISMQERLRLVQGDLVVESSVGAGTAVRASVPVRAPAADAASSVRGPGSGETGSAVLLDRPSLAIDNGVNRR
jgi:PAS domain S-box-containing protein